MKSRLKFIDFASGAISDCGDALKIEVSSYNLNWDGVLLEKGWSPHFYPKNIVTPYFYFALAIDSKFKWSAEDKGEFIELKTNPGEIWMNPPDVPFTHIIDDPCYFIIFTIDEKTLIKHFEDKLPDDKLQFLKNYNVNDQSLEFFIKLFYNEVCNQGRNGNQYFQNMLKMFSVYYIRNYSNYPDLISKKNRSSRINSDDIARITDYINENIENTITIDDLAEITDCSKYYFLKEFQKFMNITPYQYILKIKLEKAKELLKIKENQIIDVAYKLGFSDQSHFTNSFKKHFGCTPSVFKSS